MISIVRHSNEWIVGIDSEAFLFLSRNEQLHPLLDVLAENDEEDELLSSKFRMQRERMFPWFNTYPMPSVHRNNS